jgi:hypothetical protein
MVARMIIRRRPRVVLPELPFKRTSRGDSAIMAREEKNQDPMGKKMSKQPSTCPGS